MTFALAVIASVACASGAPPAPAGRAGAYHPSAPARPGGTVVLADFEAPQVLHPLAARTDVELRWGTLLFAPLWGLDPAMQPFPNLARAVPTRANGGVRTSRDGHSTTVDVRLVAGLRWSDGSPITAEDVIFTWHALRDPSLSLLAPVGIEHVRRMDRRSDTELVWTFDRPYAGYVQLGASLFPLPAHRLAGAAPGALAQDGFFQRPDVVSGPFALGGVVPGDHLTLTANRRYADGRSISGAYPGGAGPFDHSPYLERVVLQVAPGRAFEVRAALAQGVDVAFHLLPEDLADLHGATGSASLVTTGLRDEFLNPNHAVDTATAKPPPWVGDPAVLRALDQALDRDGLVRDLLGGAGRPARGLYPRALAGFATGTALPSGPDLEGARRLLRTAGWLPGSDGVRVKNGRRLAFSLTGVCGRAGIDRELDLLRRQWLRLGADVTTGCQQRDVFFRGNADGAFDMTLYSNQWAPDPGAWAPMGASRGPASWNRCRIGALDAALARVGATFDPAGRRGAARDVEREWLSSRCTIPLFEWPEVRQVSSRLRNFTPVAAAADSWNAADWWMKG